MTQSAPNQDYEGVFRAWRDATLSSWSRVTAETIESDTFNSLMGASRDVFLAQQKRVRDASAQTLELMDVPSKSDLARLSKQVLQCEKRIVDLEERLDEALDILREMREQFAPEKTTKRRKKA